MNQTHTVLIAIAITLAVVALGFSALVVVTRAPSVAFPPPPPLSATPAELTRTDAFPPPLTQAEQKGRAWGPEQATGAPDSFQYGDMETAWASLTPDAQEEWLALLFDPVMGTAIQIYETFNPGAVSKVTILTAEGKERTIYEAPAQVLPKTPRVFEVPLNGEETIIEVKLALDSPAVPGWNEIDAVGIRDAAGQLHWAAFANASSTYAVPN